MQEDPSVSVSPSGAFQIGVDGMRPASRITFRAGPVPAPECPVPEVQSFIARDRRQVTTMRIANVALDASKNYRSRLLDWLRDSRPGPDIVTLQKIGASKHFPTDALGDLGYESWPLWKKDGSDLGVAVLSRRRRNGSQPKVLCCELPGGEQRESRFLTVEVGGLCVSSVYAPYGPESLGRQVAIDRRVRWLKRLRRHVHQKGYADRASLLCGDFNVQFKADGPRTGNLYSQKEEDALAELLDLGFYDLYRKAHPDPGEKRGRTRGYPESDESDTGGTSRLHLILASKRLAPHLRDVRRDLRVKRPRPDAPPLIAEFEDLAA